MTIMVFLHSQALLSGASMCQVFTSMAMLAWRWRASISSRRRMLSAARSCACLISRSCSARALCSITSLSFAAFALRNFLVLDQVA